MAAVEGALAEGGHPGDGLSFLFFFFLRLSGEAGQKGRGTEDGGREEGEEEMGRMRVLSFAAGGGCGPPGLETCCVRSL